MEWMVLIAALIGSFTGSLFATMLLFHKNKPLDLPSFTPRVDVAKVSRANSPSFRARRQRESEGPEYRPGDR